MKSRERYYVSPNHHHKVRPNGDTKPLSESIHQKTSNENPIKNTHIHQNHKVEKLVTTKQYLKAEDNGSKRELLKGTK
jgi:hypothetical protein